MHVRRERSESMHSRASSNCSTDSIASLVEEDTMKIISVYGPTLNPPKMLHSKPKPIPPSKLSIKVAGESAVASGPYSLPLLKEELDRKYPKIPPFSPQQQQHESPTCHDADSSPEIHPTTKKFSRKPKEVKPFVCRYPACNKSFSLAFEQVVHERTCQCGDFPTASKVHLGKLKLPQELCIPSPGQWRRQESLPSLGSMKK